MCWWTPLPGDSLANGFELNVLLTPNSFLQPLVSALALKIYLHQHSICANQIKEWIQGQITSPEFYFFKIQISSLMPVPKQLHKPLCWCGKRKTCCYRPKSGGKHIRCYLPLIINTQEILYLIS